MKRLFYRNIAFQNQVNNIARLESYFDASPVFWLDNTIHKWPHGKGAEIENTIIKDMFIGNNPDFESLLKQIANNYSTGFQDVLELNAKIKNKTDDRYCRN